MKYCTGLTSVFLGMEAQNDLFGMASEPAAFFTAFWYTIPPNRYNDSVANTLGKEEARGSVTDKVLESGEALGSITDKVLESEEARGSVRDKIQEIGEAWGSVTDKVQESGEAWGSGKHGDQSRTRF